MDERARGAAAFDVEPLDTSADVSRFAESYASFNRIINGLQRQYLQMKEESSAQNDQLVEVNARLVGVTKQNLAATEFLNEILKSMSTGVIAVDQNGRITHFNPAASVLLGMPGGEPVGKLYRDVVLAGLPPDANCLRSAETGKIVEGVEKQMTLADGTLLHLSVSTAILRDKDGRPNGAMEVFHDLTKLKKMEQELVRLHTLAALGEMAATIAHEVRNPLAGIGGFAALLRRDLADADPRRELVDKIICGVENLNQTVTTLLNYTRYDEVNKEDVRLDEFLRVAIEQFRRDNAERVHHVEVELIPTVADGREPVMVRADTLLMRQLLFNLLSNAVEAMDGKGTIEICCRKLNRGEVALLNSERLVLGLDETIVETTIIDTGPGIQAESMEKIFTPFFTTKQGGTGLGLAVAWKIMKAHGGEIVADNLPLRGARFRLLMPTKIGSIRLE